MSRSDYRRVRILLAMDNLMVRQGLQQSLQSVGFERAVEAPSAQRLIESLQASQFDLLLVSSELEQQPVAPLMARMRQGIYSHHPVPIVIQFLSESNPDYIRRVLDSGPDDVLQMPVSPAMLLSRVAALIEKRRPFVVTSEYVGPSRRVMLRPGTMVTPELEVPNPLAAMTCDRTEEALAEDIGRVSVELRDMRLARYVFEMQWLALAIRRGFEAGSKDLAKLASACERIKILTARVLEICHQRGSRDLDALCGKLAAAADTLMEDGYAVGAGVLPTMSTMVARISSDLCKSLPPAVAASARFGPSARRQPPHPVVV